MRTLLVLVMPIILLSACKKEAEVVAEPVRTVKTITISEGAKANSRKISGIVKTSDESELSFRVAGRVATVDVKIGDLVEKGQVLATLERKTYLLAVKSAKAQLASARADLLEKSDDLKRQKNLKKKDFVSQSAVDQSQASYSASRSNVDVAKTVLSNAQHDLNDTVLKAPFDGAIAERTVDAFVDIAAGQGVFDLQSEDGLKVEVLMPETLIRDVSHGDVVHVSFPTLSDTVIIGKVAEIGAKADQGNAFPVKVDLSKTPPEIRVGMTAQVSFNFGEAHDKKVYLIPVSALDVRISSATDKVTQGEAPVFLFNPTKKVAERHMVTIGDINGNKFEVVKGLKAGDILIVAGIPFITDGQSVTQWKPAYNEPATINLNGIHTPK